MDKNSDNNGSRRSGPDSDNNSDGRPQLPKRSNNSLLIFLILASLLALLFYQQTEKRSEILVSQFQEELEKDNVADVRIADRYVFGEFKIPPDAPLSEVSDGKSKSDEPGEPKKLLKEFAVVRPNDAGWVVNLENELKAKQIRFGYQVARRNAADALAVRHDRFAFGDSVLPIHDVSPHPQRFDGWRIPVWLQQESRKEIRGQRKNGDV